MTNQASASKLVEIYFYVCKKYENQLQYHCEQFTNNSSPEFTDQELMTIYLFCVHQEQRFTIQKIYNFTRDYLMDWFPKLPSYYVAFNTQLNEAFRVLSQSLLSEFTPDDISLNSSLVDSLPIITCSGR